ncbi:MAG: SPOR domain-containing protein [Alcanivoracaceae bacterium]|nr:SPOR domain-containing protein [Alcanivoracaceae bacterium]
MRWVFFCLLILNVVYLVSGLVMRAAPSASVAVAAPLSTTDQRLVLLSEAGIDGSYSVNEGTVKTPLCVTLGPWAERLGAQKQLAALSEKGYQGRVRAVDVAKDRLHWVYLPAYESRDAALRVLRQLQTQGVDSFIVADGVDTNAISLGYFSSADSARGLMVKMKTAGYPAQTRETERRELEYWIYFDKSGVPDEGESIRVVLAGNDFLSGQNVACEMGVVQPSQAPELIEE